MKYRKLEKLVLKWAKKRGLLGENANVNKQALKSASEMGELCDAICKDDRPEQIDAIGDVMVTLIILANQLNLDLIDCLQVAYYVIRQRTGETKNGVFIKDLPDPEEIFKKEK